MASSESIYIIKPEAMHAVQDIHQRLETNLAIVATKTLILPNWALGELYNDLGDELREATALAFKRPVEFGVVQVDDAVETLLEIAGRETKPADCAPKTIRFNYGIWRPVMFGSVAYYQNAIHRPKTDGEATLHRDLFDRLT